MGNDDPGRALPAGLAKLQRISTALAGVSHTGPGRGLRAVVSVPHLRLATAVAALGARVGRQSCQGCPHLRRLPGSRVACYLDGAYTDATLIAADHAQLRVGGMTLTRNLDSVHALPEGFPDRTRSIPSPGLRDAAAQLWNVSAAVAPFRQSAASAHPVVVAGQTAAFAADVELLAVASDRVHAGARLDFGRAVYDWFRHPVLVVSHLPGPAEAPWAAALDPALVVVAGAASWRRSWRWTWPDVPVLTLLPRRSATVAEVAETVIGVGWAPVDPTELGLAPGPFTPGDGLEVLLLREPDAAAADPDEDLW